MLRIEYKPTKFFELDTLGTIRTDDGLMEQLTATEYSLLKLLLRNPGRVVEKETIAREVWEEEYSAWLPEDWKSWKENSLGSALSEIRGKIKSIMPDAENLIRVKRGIGWYSDYVSKEEIEKSSDNKSDGNKIFDLSEAMCPVLAEEYREIKPLSDEYHCKRTYLMEKIDKAFQRKRVVYVSGLSGSGKTEAAYCYGNENEFTYIVPLALRSNGSGDFEYLCSQVKIDNKSSDADAMKLLWSLEEKSLIIIDNYNDASNDVIFDVLKKIPHARILITTQLKTDEMDEHGSVVLIDDAEENEADKEKFAIQLFCTYAKLNGAELSQADLSYLADIVKAVQYHTMISCMLGRQYKKYKRSFQQLRDLIVENVEEALRTNIKVSIIKDKERYTQTPYELMKVLFKNQIISREFSLLERQVLGALIFSEKYSNDLDMICVSVGDLEELNCVSARDAVNSLQEDGIVAIQGSRLHIHPLMRALVCDEGLGLAKYPMIAELDYEFLLHLMKNKQIEKYTYAEENIERDTQVRNMTPWHKWVFEFIEQNVIPYTCSRDKEFAQYYNNEDYLLVSCHGTSGNSIYIRFDSGKEFCLINGSGQRIKEYRYYNPNKEEKEFSYEKCSLLYAKYGLVDKLVLPETVAGAPVLSIGRRLLYNHKMKHVVIPSEVQWIGDYAFCDCTELEEIIIPDKVGIIGSRAFTNCSNATKLQLGKSVRTIGMATFSRCEKIKGTIEFPDSLQIIHRYAFFQCSALEEVYFSDTSQIEEIGTCAFSTCTRLQKVRLGKTVSWISGEAFADCYSLEEVTLPGTLKEISTNLFSNCSGLKKIIVEEGVEVIHNHAFGDCVNLSEVKLPRSITSLDKAAFGGSPNVVAEVYENSSADRCILRANELGRRIAIKLIAE